MIVHDTAVAFVAVIRAAIAWAGVIGGALGFVGCVVAFSVGPLIAPRARARGCAPAGGPQGSSDVPDVTDTPERPSERRMPSWAHTQPTDPTDDYQEAA